MLKVSLKEYNARRENEYYKKIVSWNNDGGINSKSFDRHYWTE